MSNTLKKWLIFLMSMKGPEAYSKDLNKRRMMTTALLTFRLNEQRKRERRSNFLILDLK